MRPAVKVGASGAGLRSLEGRAALGWLIEAADVVIEGARMLRQLGIDAETVLAPSRDKVRISITAYGRTGLWANVPRSGDAALAAALLAFDPGCRRSARTASTPCRPWPS